MTALIAVAGRLAQPHQAAKAVPHEDHAVAAPSRYIRALHRAGAHEAILHPVSIDTVEAKLRLTRFDGLLLMGGGDVDPSLYGQDPHPTVGGVETDRDSFELSLLGAAFDLAMPVLAVCRGVQVLNVALGGTLHQHIGDREHLGDHGGPGRADWVRHKVELEPGSLVSSVMGASRVEVGSHHHQALDQLGDGLVVTGRAEDGLVEAVEMKSGFVLGVQWHPELTADEDPHQQRLFDGLVEAASR